MRVTSTQRVTGHLVPSTQRFRIGSGRDLVPSNAEWLWRDARPAVVIAKLAELLINALRNSLRATTVPEAGVEAWVLDDCGVVAFWAGGVEVGFSPATLCGPFGFRSLLRSLRRRCLLLIAHDDL